MNKKGLIFVILFVVSTVSAVVLSTAEQSDNKVEITFDYIPSAYVPGDQVYVEFDTRFIRDGDVFTEEDIINFAFFYDVAVLSWANYYYTYYYGETILYTTGDGNQNDVWLYADENNVTEGYTGSDKYNVTRFAGMFNLMLDDYDLGMSNFGIDEDKGTYQEININLDVGWHYLTVVAAEIVSDANHTEFHWEYCKDQVSFYVAEDRLDIPPLIEDALYNSVELVATAVDSEDLGQYYSWNWTSELDSPRPIAEAQDPVYQTVDIATEAAPIVTQANLIFNASNNPLEVVPAFWGSEYAGVDTMGEYTYLWHVNDGEAQNLGNGTWYEVDSITGELIPEWRVGVTELSLKKGQNYIFFNLFSSNVDDFSTLYGLHAPGVGHDLAVMRIFVGEVDGTGMGFGILISVSMLGLVSYAFLRKRK